MANGVSRSTRIVLIASLALNVFALGAFTSALVLDGSRWFGDRERPRRFIGMPSPHRLRAALDEGDQRTLHAAMEAHRSEIRARIRGIRAARRDVAEAIRAQPFDRARLDAALVRLRESEGATATEIHGMIAELVAKLDADGRARVAELIPSRARRGRGG